MIEKLISKNKSTDKKRKILKTIPGINNTTKVALPAELFELSNLKTTRKLVDYIVITPMHNVLSKSI